MPDDKEKERLNATKLIKEYFGFKEGAEVGGLRRGVQGAHARRQEAVVRGYRQRYSYVLVV
jgi:hypothetical protein